MDERTMTTLSTERTESRWIRRHIGSLTASVLMAALAIGTADAQDFQRPDAAENIADSEISVEDTNAAERADELLATIGALPESVDRIKIITTMEKIDVVYLSDLVGESAPKEITEAIEASKDRILQLQKAIESSAIFYNALTSREVNISDVVSIELKEPNATIFVRGVPPDEGLTLDELEEAENPEGATAEEDTPPEEAPAEENGNTEEPPTEPQQ